MRFWLSLILCGALAGASPRVAGADPTDADFARARAAYEAGNRDEAYKLYRALWQRKKTFDVAGNLAQVELDLGKKVDAAQHLRAALDSFPPSGDPVRRQNLERALAGLRQELGALLVVVDVAQAEILIGTRSIGQSPLPHEVLVDPGSHVVVARRDGYADGRATIVVTRAQAQRVELHLVKEPGAPVVPGSDRNKRSMLPLVLGGSAALIGAGIGIGLLVASGGAASDAEALEKKIEGGNGSCGPGSPSALAEDCQAYADERSSHDALQMGSGVAFGVAGVAAVGGLAWWLLSDDGSAGSVSGQRATRIAPTATRHGSMLFVSGSF
ncbi:MAG: PEGA domain-containing protein [Polyangiaceae bacterium]